MRAIILSLGILLLATQTGEASTPRTIDCNDRGCFEGTVQKVKPRHKQYRDTRYAKRTGHERRHAKSVVVDGVRKRVEAQILPHPAGCPATRFCGCGAAIEVFGRPIRELWLARNWFKFKAAEPAPGRVAVRHDHVFVIRKVLGHGLVLAYDANSGGHRTRLWVRSLDGYKVVNPHG